MQAYVLEADPIHENSVNYFSAALGFHRLGYEVERFRLSELPLLRVSAETPVFGGMQSILRLFPSYRSLPHYPVELAGFLGREIQVKRLGEVKQGEFLALMGPSGSGNMVAFHGIFLLGPRPGNGLRESLTPSEKLLKVSSC